MNYIKHLFTGIDGETYDPARTLWIVGVLIFLLFTGYEVYKSGHFDMINYGLAYSGLLAGGAAGVRIKSATEPQAKDPTT